MTEKNTLSEVQKVTNLPKNLQMAHFNDLGFSLIESFQAGRSVLYRHDTGQVFVVSRMLAQIASMLGQGAKWAELDQECRIRGVDPARVEKILRETLLTRPDTPPIAATPTFYTLIPVTRPRTLTLTLGHLSPHFPEYIKSLGEQVRREGELQGVVTVSAPSHVPANPLAWCSELHKIRRIVDTVQLSTDADLRIVLRAHAALCPELAEVTSVVDHLSAEFSEHDDFAPLADLGNGWKSISMRLRSEYIQDVPAMLRRWRDEGANFFELPLSLSTAVYTEIHDELLPTAERRAILVHHYCLLYARLLRRDLTPGLVEAQTEECAGGRPCWARNLCPGYPRGNSQCSQLISLAALVIDDFDTIAEQLKQYIYGFTHGQRLQHVMDFISNLADAISLGWGSTDTSRRVN